MSETVIYLLENYNLEALELESDIIADGRREITYKRMDTDEGGHFLDKHYNEYKIASHAAEIKRLSEKLFEAELWVNNESYTFENDIKELNDYAERME